MMHLMLQLDEFESVFKSAAKVRYEPTQVSLSKVMVVADLEGDAAALFARDVEQWLGATLTGEPSWNLCAGTDFVTVDELLEQVEHRRPDLVCTYRNLHGRARGFPFSLGSHVDVLTQATTTPVLLLPTPNTEQRLAEACAPVRTSLIVSDQLTGAHPLMDWAQATTASDGHLVLLHLEDDATFRRYLEVIGKLPSIDTETAANDIQQQLLKEPYDYATTVSEVLRTSHPDLRVTAEIRMGHRVNDVVRLATDRQANLVIMNTKDDEQLAMHGLAYPIAVALRSIPLLLL